MTLTPRQKQLRGKTVKTFHGKQYKRAFCRVQGEGGIEKTRRMEQQERKARVNITTPQENKKNRGKCSRKLRKKKEELERNNRE